MESEVRPTGVQLKRKAKLQTVTVCIPGFKPNHDL